MRSASVLKPYLRQLVREIAIEAGCKEGLNYDSPLMDAGLELLETINFRSLLSRKLCNVWLSETLIFDYPTIRAIAEMLGSGQNKAIVVPRAIPQADCILTSVAIVGVSCRFPGKCNDLTSFLNMMATKSAEMNFKKPVFCV